MSENLPPNNTSDDVDLGQLFKALGNSFDRFIRFIGSIFKSILSAIVFVLKAFITNFKLIVVVLLVAFGLGIGLEKMKPDVYSSEILVRPYFDSKYQLINNVNYYNALISDADYPTLSSIFELNEEEAKTIVDFEINFGPETENERIVQFDKFVKSIDSTRALEIDYNDFIEDRSIYSGDLYQIKVSSLKRDIFLKLENGFKNSFTNEYIDNKKQKRDSLISIQRKNIEDQLVKVDSLQQVYLKVLNQESRSSKSEISFGGEGLSLNSDKTNTREYELLNKEIQLRNDLRNLDSKKVEDDVFFDIIASFQRIGNKEVEFTDRYSILFPALALILLIFIYVTMMVVKFVNNYEE
jgi:hypothetical protein